jgi:integrase
MPRVVPSQVRDLIAVAFPFVLSAENAPVSIASVGELSAVVSLAKQVPDHLLTVTASDLSDYTRAISAIEYTLQFWLIQKGVRNLWSVGKESPLVVLHRVLAKCPDALPSPMTAELLFVTDGALRESIRLDVSSADRDFINTEWKGATVLAGSATEALLLWVVKEADRKQAGAIQSAVSGALSARFLRQKPDSDPERWSLGEYIEVALQLKLIKDQTAQQARLAKDFRNLRLQLASGDTSGATQRDDTRGAPKTLVQLLDKAAPLVWNGSDHGKDAEGKVRRIAARLGDPQLSDLNTGHVDDVILWLREEGRSPATVNRYLSALHVVLDWGHAKGRAHVQLMPDFGWQDEDQGRLRWLSRDEEVRLVATLTDLGQEEIADFIMGAIDTGCRRSELLTAKPDQHDGNWLRLWRTKNGDARSVPLTPRAWGILRRRLPWSFSDSQLRYWFDKAKELMGLSADEDFVIHACRHTTATRLVERGVNLRVVQSFMGHRAIQTTLRYAHVSDELLADAATRLSQADYIQVRNEVGALVEGETQPPRLVAPTESTEEQVNVA